MEVANVPLVYKEDPFLRIKKDILVLITQLEPPQKDVGENEGGNKDEGDEEEKEEKVLIIHEA